MKAERHTKEGKGGGDRHEIAVSGRLAFTVTEVADALGISKSAAYEYVRAGEIPAVRVGRRWLVPVAALEALLGGAAA